MNGRVEYKVNGAESSFGQTGHSSETKTKARKVTPIACWAPCDVYPALQGHNHPHDAVRRDGKHPLSPLTCPVSVESV